MSKNGLCTVIGSHCLMPLLLLTVEHCVTILYRVHFLIQSLVCTIIILVLDHTVW